MLRAYNDSAPTAREPDIEQIELENLSAQKDSSFRNIQEYTANTRVANDAGTGAASQNHDLEPPENAFEDSTPTRRYQSMLLICGFLMIFQVIGINSIYGVFQEYYTSTESNIRDAHGQDALVSLVGTIGYGLTWGGGIFVNPIIVRVKNLKFITLPGTVIMSLGLILASFSTKLWHLFITQALLFGLGATMLYFPIMSLAPRFFNKNRGLAMGFILSGNGVGGLVLAPTVHALIRRAGVSWTLRILGLWTFVLMTPVALVPRHPPGFEARRRGGPGSRLTVSLLTRGTFAAQAIGCFLQAAGNFVPLFYLPSFSTSVLQYSSATGSLLLALNNAVNSVARIVMGHLADRVGRQNTLVVSVLLSSLSVFALWYNASQTRFIAFTVVYGILAGGYNALLPTTITEVYGVQNYDAVNGAIYFLRGLGAVAGPPIAGAILGSHSRGTVVPSISSFGAASALDILEKKYNDLVVYTGMLLVGASFCVAYVRWGDAKDKGQWLWKA